MKKGQFYLFTSLLLIILLVGIIPRTIQIEEREEVLSEAITNFVGEVPFVINNAIYHDANITSMLEDFSLSFLNHARQRDPNFGYVLILKNKNETIMMNYLKESITIDSSEDLIQNLSSGDSKIIGSSRIFYVNIEDGTYRYEFDDMPDMQLKMLFKSYKGENIYIKEV